MTSTERSRRHRLKLRATKPRQVTVDGDMVAKLKAGIRDLEAELANAHAATEHNGNHFK